MLWGCCRRAVRWEVLCGRGAAPLLPLMIRDGAVGPVGWPGRLSPLPVAARRGDGRVRAASNTALPPLEGRKTAPQGREGDVGVRSGGG